MQMQASCSICSENYNIVSDIRATLCGHIFHYECIISWLERSSSCPQCRKPVAAFNINRIYLNFENNEGEYHLSRSCDAEQLRSQLEILQIENSSLRNEVNDKSENLEEMQAICSSLRDLETNRPQLDAEQLDQQLQYALSQNSLLEFDLIKCKNEIAELRMKNLSLTEEIIPNAEKRIEDLQNQLKFMVIDINSTVDCSHDNFFNIGNHSNEPVIQNVQNCGSPKSSKRNNRNEKTQFKKQFNNLKKSTFNQNNHANTSKNSNILFGIDSEEEGRIIENLLTQVQINNEEIVKEVGNLIKQVNIEEKKK